jgi:hypothetical protein
MIPLCVVVIDDIRDICDICNVVVMFVMWTAERLVRGDGDEHLHLVVHHQHLPGQAEE